MARLTAAEKLRRDAQVVADRARGLRWTTIAQRHEISERHARTVWVSARESEPAFGQDDPVEILRDALLQQESLIEELALLAEDADHDAVILGALKTKLEAIERRLALLRAVGLLPHDLGALRQELELRQVLQLIGGVFDRYDVPAEAELELRVLLGRQSRNGQVELPSETGA